MNKAVLILCALLALGATTAYADKATEQSVIKAIVDGNAYVKKNLKGMDDAIAKEGSLEFWSSGGLLQKVDADTTPQEFDSFNLNPKHITVITLVPGQVAVAQYYSEGSMSPKNSAAVSNYLTRVTEVYVNEGGKWKTRAAHYSRVAGGAGTSQTAIDD